MRLFISYSHNDDAAVQEIVDILRRARHEPWIDHQLVGGKDWQEQLQQNIRQCDALIYMISPDSAASKYCLWELEQAQKMGKPIIPLRLAKSNIPQVIRRIQFIDFSQGTTPDAVARLMGDLQQIESDGRGIPRWFIGVASILVLVIAGFVILSGRDANPEPVSASTNPTTTFTSIPSITSTEVPATSTFTPTLTHTIESTATNTIHPTSTNLPTSTPTNTATLTLTPTETPLPTATHTALPSPTIQPSPTTDAAIQTSGFQPTIVFDPLTGHTKAFVPPGAFTDEKGSTSASFWIDVYEVTNELFIEFLNARGWQRSAQETYFNRNTSESGITLSNRFQPKSDYEQMPAVHVTWYGAYEYCLWVNGRLPTATEWHKASSWNPTTNLSTIYTWGDAVDPDAANINGTALQEVGSFPRGISPIGAYDLPGNVWEWLARAQGVNRYFVGGAYDTAWRDLSLTEERQSIANNSAANLGFRCVYDE